VIELFASLRTPWKSRLFALIMAETAAGLETTLVFAALPTLMRTLHQPVLAAWLITAYLLVSASSAAAGARLGDLFGRKKVLAAVLFAASLGSLISFTVSDIRWIVAGRAIQGLAGAVLPLCYGIARECLPQEKVPVGIGAVNAANGLCAAIGFVLGGLIVDHAQWQYVFACSGIICALALLSLAFIPASPARSGAPQSDLLGGLLFTPAVAVLLWAITAFQSGGAAHFSSWAWLAASLVLLAGWAWHEARHPFPLIDVRLLARRDILICNVAVIGASLGSLQVLQVFPLLLQQPVWTGVGFGVTATLTGLLKLPSNLASAASATWAGDLCRRIGARGVVIAGAWSSFLAWTILAFDHSSLWLTVLLSCMSASGFAILFTGTINIIVKAAPSDRTSEATAMTVTIRTVAQTIGSQIILVVFARSMVHANGLSFSSPLAFTLVFGFLSAVSAISIVAAPLLPKAKVDPVC